MSEALATVLEHMRGFFQHLHEAGLIAYDDFQAFSAAFAAFKAAQTSQVAPTTGGVPTGPGETPDAANG